MNGGGAETLSPGPLGGNLEPVLRPRHLLPARPSPPCVQNRWPQNSACPCLYRLCLHQSQRAQSGNDRFIIHLESYQLTVFFKLCIAPEESLLGWEGLGCVRDVKSEERRRALVLELECGSPDSAELLPGFSFCLWMPPPPCQSHRRLDSLGPTRDI